MSRAPSERASLRVALLSPCFWPEVARGTERIVRELADGLLADGHRPRLITSHDGRPSRTVEDGLPIVRVPRLPAGRLQRRRFEDHLTHLPFSYAALRAGRQDIAHAFFQADALVAARWSAATGRPSVFTFTGLPDRPGLTYRRFRLPIVQAAVAGVSAVVALSQAAADEFEHTLGVRTRVVYPGVDLARFRPCAPRHEQPTIFCAASYEEGRKRVALLVRAFELLRRELPRARLVLRRPEDPALAERLQREVAGIELIDPGELHARLEQFYSQAWVSVLPSFGEAFGMVLVESLACGTPVVATRWGGMPEIVDRPEVGRLFEGPQVDPDPARLADAIREALMLLEDPATPARCRTRAEDFGVERATQAYIALYRELLGEATAVAEATPTGAESSAAPTAAARRR